MDSLGMSDVNACDRRGSTLELFARKYDSNKKMIFVAVAVIVLGFLVCIALILGVIAIRDWSSVKRARASGQTNKDREQALREVIAAYLQPIVMDAGSSSLEAARRKGAVKPVWTLQRGHDYGAHEYIDQEGYLQGFTNDVVSAVCGAAGVECRLVWDRYNNCWNSSAGEHSQGGEGLLDGWYDGCMGWYTTLDRIHMFSFSQAYLKPPVSNFYVKLGNPEKFWPGNVINKLIGFLDGWASDEKCLARQQAVVGSFLPAGKVRHYVDPNALKNAIMNGEVDAGFATYESMEQFVGFGGNLQKLPQEIECMIDGNALMARKDSPFISLWNDGFKKIRSNGEFRKLCEEGKRHHGVYGSIDCVDS